MSTVTSSLFILTDIISGDDSSEATPLPIPNRVVKLTCADGTAWATLWESRLSPDFFLPYPHLLFAAKTLRREEMNNDLNHDFLDYS